MIGIGINNTISISNTIKITANIKNRVENGMRAEFIGSNPHSNGDDFSRSEEDRIITIIEIINRIGGTIVQIIVVTSIIFIN